MNYFYYIILSLFLKIIFCTNANANIEYLIYTTNNFSSHAERIKKLYMEDINENLQLETQIIYHNSNEENFFNNYLFDLENNFDFDNLEYLLIIGDENIIPPSNECVNTATDDYYSTPFILEEGQSCNNNPPNPLLKTGRILINDYTSFKIIENIENYILNPYIGSWNSELLLFCDDQYKSGQDISLEKSHIINSDKIYKSLKNNLNISCLYGSEFDRQQSIDWFSQPEFTDRLIESINNGVGVINYIGHGTSEFLADEDILTIPDLERISIVNNKLPIWVVGTCSFGNYLNENCFADALLNKGDAAIAIISTTGGVSYNDNYLYLSSFFETHLKNYTNSEAGYENYRLGDIFTDAKNGIEQLSKRYTFNLFGDPAMPINLPKASNLLNLEDPLYIGSINNLSLNEPGEYSVKILNEDKHKCYCIGCEEYCQGSCLSNNGCTEDNNCDNANLISYHLPGDILFLNQNNVYENQSNIFPYVLPLDANSDNNASLKIYNHDLNQMETLSCLDLDMSADNSSLDDNEGPDIKFFQNNSRIESGSTIYPPYEIEIFLTDNNPINLSGFNFHNLRFWYNNDETNSIILNNNFNQNFIDQQYSGSAYIILDSSIDINKINVEAWDIINNPTILSLNVRIADNSIIYNVYNFPNPFEEKTFFTFGYSNSSPIDIQIDIYSLDGTKIKSINKKNVTSNGSNFIKVPTNGWDGRLDNGNKISNGTYVYHLKILQYANIIHDGIYKLTKLE